MPVPVIDLFAGPGGLGEGFSSFSPSPRSPWADAARLAQANPQSEGSRFRVVLSIEKDPVARTLRNCSSFIRMQLAYVERTSECSWLQP